MLIQANAATIPLADGSVHVCATSPPFWGLRKYAGDQGFSWPSMEYAPLPGLSPIVIPAMRCDLGLEPTPEAYVGHLVLTARELWRVLREDGCFWLNLGDSYAGSWGNYAPGGIKGNQRERTEDGKRWERNAYSDTTFRPPTSNSGTSLKPKDLVMIPARAALALQADGWYLRSDIIWEKPNALPESVTDRPTKSHENIYLLTKSARYFYDHVAVRQAASEASLKRIQQSTFDTQTGGEKDYGTAGVNGNRSMRRTLENFALNPGRNLRDVWAIPTAPSSVPHFATWPSALVERMLKASISERGCCPQCGAQWRRVVERIPADDPSGYKGSKFNSGKTETPHANTGQGQRYERGQTLGWQPSCACGIETTAKATVLDPFAGSGTTGAVAANLGARFVGLDLGYTYLRDIAAPRLSTAFGGATPKPNGHSTESWSNLPLFQEPAP